MVSLIIIDLQKICSQFAQLNLIKSPAFAGLFVQFDPCLISGSASPQTLAHSGMLM